VCSSDLNVGRYTPNQAVIGFMGWIPPEVRQKANQARLWFRLCKMDNSRLTKHIFTTSHRLAERNKRNWCKGLMALFDNLDLNLLKTINECNSCNAKVMLKTVVSKLKLNFERQWYDKLHRNNTQTAGGNKLRTYRLFKSEIFPEDYVTLHLNRQHRRALAQFRMGTAPLKLETDRYSNSGYIPVSSRVCPFCNFKEVEDECHALIRCSSHKNIRSELFRMVVDYDTDFINKSDTEKLLYLLSNNIWYKDVARSLYSIILNRRDKIYLMQKHGS
jgi:hypothetical protein